jgi:hypothetical protein
MVIDRKIGLCIFALLIAVIAAITDRGELAILRDKEEDAAFMTCALW